MSNTFPPKIAFVLFIALFAGTALVGCSHSKTNRGHLFRGDWAFEYNRTPWIGLPPDSGCPEESEEDSHGLFDCLKKDNDKERKGFRRHCGMNAQCTAQNPCCRTLGCGMWVDPADPAALASLGGTAKACGLTPFCLPQKPCRLTPNCGKPINVNVNPQTLMAANPSLPFGLGGMTGRNFGADNTLGHTLGNVKGNAIMPNGMATVRGMNPNATMPGGIDNAVQGAVPGGIPGSLVSRGIVPGASTITSGGLVAAIGVSTPAGTMTPVGVRMQNGLVNNAIVLRACLMTPNCTAAHPCGLTPNCGGAVAVNLVSNNAVALASALQTQGAAGNVMQAGGMGMLVNPMTNQPINGMTMGGYAQAGYPPIGYAPTGYAPGYPRFAAGMVDTGEQATEEEEIQSEEESIVLETRSAMPVPRFHPIPSKPAFQRSEGMPPTPKAQRTVAKPTTTAQNEPQVSEEELETALDQAYLEGVSAAMNEVERKLEKKRQAAAKVKLEEKILRQAESVQEQLEEQDKIRMLVLQRERQLRQQQAARMQPESLTAEVVEPQRLPTPHRTAVSQSVVQQSPKVVVGTRPNPPQQQVLVVNAANPTSGLEVSPVRLAKNLRTSVMNKMNGVLAPLLGANQNETASPTSQPRQSSAKAAEVAITPPNLPGRPSVLSKKQNYGLLPEKESESSIQQARFAEDE